MTGLAPAPAAAPARRSRRVLGWASFVVALVLFALVGASLLPEEWSARQPLDPESAGTDGTRALVQVLRGQGVEVTIARSRDEAQAALAGGDATLVMPAASMLSLDAIDGLAEPARDVVLIEPRSRLLDALVAGSSLGGVTDGEAVAPSCDLPVARAAGPAGTGELLLPGDGVRACYPQADGFGLLVAEKDDGRTVAAVDGLATMTNDRLAADGNAALAIGLLGRNAEVVWYVPALTDADTTGEPPTLGDLTPPWVTPAIVLLIVATAAAAVWRGRRFGPLVKERLPVMVRTGETTEGRARLYVASGDAAHALAELRRAARARLARSLGLAASAPPERVVDAVAERLGADRAVVRGILLDTQPRNDRELVHASDRLRDLEASVHAALRTERNAR